MFVLALVHTFPFIVYHIQQGDMVKQWNTSLVYWTGVAALIAQAYLTFMSFSSIRWVLSWESYLQSNKPGTGSMNSSKRRTSLLHWPLSFSSFSTATFAFHPGTYLTSLLYIII